MRYVRGSKAPAAPHAAHHAGSPPRATWEGGVDGARAPPHAPPPSATPAAPYTASRQALARFARAKEIVDAELLEFEREAAAAAAAAVRARARAPILSLGRLTHSACSSPPCTKRRFPTPAGTTACPARVVVRARRARRLVGRDNLGAEFPLTPHSFFLTLARPRRRARADRRGGRPRRGAGSAGAAPVRPGARVPPAERARVCCGGADGDKAVGGGAPPRVRRAAPRPRAHGSAATAVVASAARAAARDAPRPPLVSYPQGLTNLPLHPSQSPPPPARRPACPCARHADALLPHPLHPPAAGCAPPHRRPPKKRPPPPAGDMKPTPCCARRRAPHAAPHGHRRRTPPLEP